MSEIPHYLDMCEPEVHIGQHGRWSYVVSIHHGLMRLGPYYGYGWVRWGRSRAERKGRRELAKYKRDEARRRNVRTIT